MAQTVATKSPSTRRRPMSSASIIALSGGSTAHGWATTAIGRLPSRGAAAVRKRCPCGSAPYIAAAMPCWTLWRVRPPGTGVSGEPPGPAQHAQAGPAWGCGSARSDGCLRHTDMRGKRCAEPGLITHGRWLEDSWGRVHSTSPRSITGTPLIDVRGRLKSPPQSLRRPSARPINPFSFTHRVIRLRKNPRQHWVCVFLREDNQGKSNQFDPAG